MNIARIVVALSVLVLWSAIPATAQTEKVAVVALGTTLVNLNPLTHIVSTMRVTNNLLFDGLTKFDDASYQPRPDLAESWTVSRDGLEYVFKLRRGVVFHDGSPFTAHDVKFSWEAICHRDNVRIADAYVDHYIQINPFLCANSRSGYCSPEMDALIVKGRSTTDPRERAKTYATFQEVFARDLPCIWIVSPSDLRLASPKLALPDRPNDFLVMKAILDWELK